MDKAAGTIMFNCQRDYVDRMQTDLDANAVFEISPRTQADIVHESNAFGSRYGFAPDMRNQDIPYYKGIDKMHKNPVGTRFISSSASSHMKRVSLLLNILFNALSLDIDQLFGEELQSMGISAAWTARSWVLKNTAELIPLLHIWNVQYAQHSPAPPPLDSCDFARLYTNIETADMHAQIMELVVCIFALPQHSNHAGIKVWQTKPAVWLRQNQMPATDQARSGTGHGGKYMIFDIHTIDVWLSFLLANMYVRFGDQIRRQIQGTPMGTNCASHLANYYLTMYELSFIMRLAALYVDVAFAFLRTVLHQIACAFLLTARYIDDLASISNPYLHHLLYVDQHFQHARITGIYPRTLLVTSVDLGDSINYMDVSIQREAGSVSRLSTVLYDKREHLPLSRLFIIKYPHASSNISSAAKYGIITSQYHRLRRIIMDRNDFTFRMAGIINYMHTKGHDVTHMMSRLHKLCRRFTELYGTNPHDIYQQAATALDAITAAS